MPTKILVQCQPAMTCLTGGLRYIKESHNFDLFQRCAIRRAKILYKMGRDEDAKNLIATLDEQKIG